MVASTDNISHEYDEKSSPRSSSPPPMPATTGNATVEQYESEVDQAMRQPGYRLPFRWASLWEPAVINPINGKSLTFPILRWWGTDPYTIAFWMATLGFFSAFFSWFAFAPLVTEAVKVDLKLTPLQITDSNLASLGGTAIVRLFAGAAVDRFGPRKVMATLLVLGAIPSALVPTVSNIGGLKTIRFFISILGGTFVPTQAWTTTFFDKSIAGTANAFSGGWGNLGGGVVPAVLIAIYRGLSKHMKPHLAWRICFLVMPVPLLLLVAGTMMIIAKDHPAGKWSQRHQLPGTAIEVAQGQSPVLDASEIREQERIREQQQGEKAPVKGADFHEVVPAGGKLLAMDTAVSEPLTKKSFFAIVTDYRVLMVALCYLSTFGLETALDAALPNLIFTIFKSPTFTAEKAAYAASLYGLLNLFFRPMGGVFADYLYRKFGPGKGLTAKVWYLLACAFLQGIMMIGMGFYVNNNPKPALGSVLGFIVMIAFFGFQANAGAYAVYGHLRPKNIGFVAGMVGSGGNVGGLMYTAIFKYHPGALTLAKSTLGTKFWIAGVFNAALILPFAIVVQLIGLGDAV